MSASLRPAAAARAVTRYISVSASKKSPRFRKSMGATMVALFVNVVIRFSAARRTSASRIGVRESANRFASAPSSIGFPGSSLSSRISFRSVS